MLARSPSTTTTRSARTNPRATTIALNSLLKEASLRRRPPWCSPAALFMAAAASGASGGAGGETSAAAAPPPLPPSVPPLADDAEWQEYHARWDRIWTDGCAPGQFFDMTSSSPTLRALLSLPLLPEQAAHLAAAAANGGAEQPPLPSIDARGKRVLVPGCGRGYDVVAFAQAGAGAAVGLELSPVAARVARAYVAGELARGRGEGAPPLPGSAEIVEGDFFASPPPSSALADASFDLGYDLTFLCALHPSMREAWAARWARLLRPGGRLVTSCYPIDDSRDANVGPPWPLEPQLYERLLLGAFEKVYLEPVPPGMSHPSRQGQEWLGVWERV